MLGSAIALLVLMAATSASAETLLMPKRDFLKGIARGRLGRFDPTG